MKSPQPPDNLPVAPLGHRHPWETERPSTAPLIEWASFDLTDKDLARFRSVLAEDLGESVKFADAEIRQMAYDTIHALAVLRELARRCPRA